MGINPPLRDKGYTHERKSNAEVECQVNDRRSIEVFGGLGRYATIFQMQLRGLLWSGPTYG